MQPAVSTLNEYIRTTGYIHNSEKGKSKVSMLSSQGNPGNGCTPSLAKHAKTAMHKKSKLTRATGKACIVDF